MRKHRLILLVAVTVVAALAFAVIAIAQSENEKVKEASFQTDGCGSSTVCGSFAAEMALGKSPSGVLDITGESILKEVGGLPEEDKHCAFLSADALQEAINDYMIKQKRRGTEKLL